MTDDKDRGLYPKFKVKRLVDPEGKHDDCSYFVLDFKHDPFAIAALEAYIEVCKDEYPELAVDLRTWVSAMKRARYG